MAIPEGYLELQKTVDNNLVTESKEIVGAINELAGKGGGDPVTAVENTISEDKKLSTKITLNSGTEINSPPVELPSGGGIVPVEALPTANKEEFDKHLLYLYKKDLHFVSTKAGDNYVATALPSTTSTGSTMYMESPVFQYHNKIYSIGHYKSNMATDTPTRIFDGVKWEENSERVDGKVSVSAYNHKKDIILLQMADAYGGATNNYLYQYDGNSVARTSILLDMDSTVCEFIHFFAVIGNYLYSCYNESGASIKCLKLNLETYAKEFLSIPNINEIKASSQWCVANNVLYIFGRAFGTEEEKTRVWKFDGTTLTRLSVHLPVSVVGNNNPHRNTCWFDGKNIRIFGSPNRVELIFNVATETFTQTTEPTATSYHNIVDMGDYCAIVYASDDSYAYKAGETYTFKKILSENE